MVAAFDQKTLKGLSREPKFLQRGRPCCASPGPASHWPGVLGWPEAGRSAIPAGLEKYFVATTPRMWDRVIISRGGYLAFYNLFGKHLYIAKKLDSKGLCGFSNLYLLSFEVLEEP